MVMSALLDFVTGIQANQLRFTQTPLIYSVGKQKAGAQTCQFQTLIMLNSKVMSFRRFSSNQEERTHFVNNVTFEPSMMGTNKYMSEHQLSTL